MRISDWSSDVCSSDLSAAFPASVSPESARAAPAAGVGTLKRFIRVYPCSSVANGLRTRAALMVAFGGVARQAAQRGDRFVVFEAVRSEEHTSELQSLMRISYAVFCLKKKK